MALKPNERPSYFDKGLWRRVPASARVKRGDVMRPCALCGWGRDMAIHCKPEGTAPAGPLGLHGWVSKDTPNVGAKLPAKAGAVSLVRDDAPSAADQAYSACRSGSA